MRWRRRWEPVAVVSSADAVGAPCLQGLSPSLAEVGMSMIGHGVVVALVTQA